MKILSSVLLIFLTIIFTSCNLQKKNNSFAEVPIDAASSSSIKKVELIEQTRGTNRSITYLATGITISLNGVETKSPMTSADWDNINKEVNLLNLPKISTYESSTTGRFSDRALASRIVITSGKSTYESTSFDEGIPPKELERLYQLLKNKSGVVRKPKMR